MSRRKDWPDGAISSTRLETGDRCWLKYWFRYHTDKERHETTALRRGAIAHAAIEELTLERLQASEPWEPQPGDAVKPAELIRKIKAQEIDDIELEADLIAGTTLWAPQIDLSSAQQAEAILEYRSPTGIHCAARVDRIDAGEAGWRAIDYKTGKGGRPPSRRRLERDIQVMLTLAALQQSKAGRDYSARWIYLDRGFGITIDIHDVDLAWLDRYLEAWTADERRREAEGDWPASVEPSCVHCPYSGACSAYQQRLAEGEAELLDAVYPDKGMMLDTLARRRARAQTLHKLARAEKDTVTAILEGKMPPEGIEIELGDGRRYVATWRDSAGKTEYQKPVSALLDAGMPPEDVDYCVELRMSRLERKLEGRPKHERDAILFAVEQHSRQIRSRYIAGTFRHGRRDS